MCDLTLKLELIIQARSLSNKRIYLSLEKKRVLYRSVMIKVEKKKDV